MEKTKKKKKKSSIYKSSPHVLSSFLVFVFFLELRDSVLSFVNNIYITISHLHSFLLLCM